MRGARRPAALAVGGPGRMMLLAMLGRSAARCVLRVWQGIPVTVGRKVRGVAAGDLARALVADVGEEGIDGGGAGGVVGRGIPGAQRGDQRLDVVVAIG